MMEWGWRRRGYSTCAGAGPASLRPERAGPLPDKSQLNELFPDRTRLNNMRNIENTLQMNLGDSYNSCRSTTTLYTDQENMYTTTEEQINMFTSNKDHYTAANNIKITKESLNLEAPTSGASEHKRRSELFPAIVGIANFISGFFNNITGVISFHQSRQTTAENIEKNNFSSKLEKEKVDFKVGPQDIFNVARYESFPEEDFFFTPRDTYDCRGQHFKVKHNEDLFFDSEPKDSGFDEADYINLDASPPIDEVDSISSFSRRDCSINSSQAIKNNTQVRPAQYVAGAAAARAPRPLLDSEGPEMDPVEQCRGKVAQIQHLLTNKTTDTPKTATKNNFPFTGYRPRARKVFVDPKSINVEDCVENFAPEPLAHMEGVVATEFVNPGVIAESELVRVETWPKVKLEPTYQQPVCFSSIVEPQGSEGSNVVVQKENNSVIKIPQEGCKSQKQPEQSIKIDESFDIVKPVSLEDISVKNDVIDISSARINETQPAVVSMSENELDSKVIDKTINLDANISQKLASSEQLNEKTVRKSEIIAKKLENVATENNDHRISETIPIGTDEQTKLLENIVTKSTMISKNASDSSKNKTELISNCEDKVSKLKALLSERKKNNREAQRAQDAETNKETRRSPDRQSLVVNRRAPSNRCRNPNSLEINQKRKQLQRNINDGEQAASSVEDSPQIVITPPDSDAFDEIRGQFTSRSASESDDSFIIVFSDSPVKSDVPRRRLPSDCGSEDSFIICFEDEVPGQSTCFTSNEVFSSADSDDELSDSDSGIKSNLLSHSFSRTVSDLTDESLYQEDAVLVSSACVESDEEEEQEEEEEEVKATGLLLTEQKKLARRGLPQKKVRFTERPPRVHVMRVWTFAARQARAGHWDKVVADRDRFKRRIADVDMAISWVLKRQHRARIKFQRFMPWWHAQRREEEALRKKREADALLRRTEEEAWLGEIESERNLEEEYGRTLGEHYVQLSREEASSGTACADVEGLVDIRDGCVEVHGENVISHDFCIECCDENVENLAVNVKSHDESVNSNNLDENLKENDNKPDSRVVVEAQVAPDIDVENVKSQNETQTYACIGNIVTTNKLTENSVANREVNPQASCAGRHFNPQRSANMRNNLYFSKVQKVQRYDKMSNALAKNDKVSISNSYKKSTQNIAGDQPRVPRVDGSVTGGVLT